MRYNKIYLIVLLVSLFASCRKDDDLGDVDNIPGLGGDTWTPTALDTWISENWTKPYNVSVKYKWDQGELEFDKVLTPPREEKIIPTLNTIKKVWIDNYVAEAGSLFMKQNIPKFFVMVGSASWNTDGTITLGTADGGRRIVLYVINDFRTKEMPGYVSTDSFNVKQMFHTIEHEFGHILQQKVIPSPDYKRISVGTYSANWYNFSDADAMEEGFITAYSMSNPDEDFVEMVATMLVEGKGGYEKLLSQIASSEARAKLRAKEAIVVNYFKDVWGINFASLQSRTRTSIDVLIK